MCFTDVRQYLLCAIAAHILPVFVCRRHVDVLPWRLDTEYQPRPRRPGDFCLHFEGFRPCATMQGARRGGVNGCPSPAGLVWNKGLPKGKQNRKGKELLFITSEQTGDTVLYYLPRASAAALRDALVITYETPHNNLSPEDRNRYTDLVVGMTKALRDLEADPVMITVHNGPVRGLIFNSLKYNHTGPLACFWEEFLYRVFEDGGLGK